MKRAVHMTYNCGWRNVEELPLRCRPVAWKRSYGSDSLPFAMAASFNVNWIPGAPCNDNATR